MQLKDPLPDDVRTPDRDNAAEQIQDLMQEGRFEEMSKADVADEIGYSRQHVSNVLDTYFQESSNGTQETVEPQGETIEITIPENVNKADYLQGFFDGYLR